MKIDDIMFQVRMKARQEALDRGEEPPEQQDMITFSRMQELIQKGELSPSEYMELENLMEDVGMVHEPDESIAQPAILTDVEKFVRQAQSVLMSNRSRTAREATPDEKLRDYAPGPPTPTKEDGPVLPLHTSILGEDLD